MRGVYNKETKELNYYSIDELKKEFWEGEHCYNCKFCWDIKSAMGDIKDAVLECLWQQSWVSNLELWESCSWHEYDEEYKK